MKDNKLFASRPGFGVREVAVGAGFAALAAALVLAVIAMAEGSMSDRRKQIFEMSPAQQEDLLRHEEQFRALSPSEQQRIRLLHAQLQKDAEGDQLRATMNQYAQWQASLTPYRRAELFELKPDQRVKQIKQMVQEQIKAGGKHVGDADRATIVQWIERYASENESRILDMLPDNRRRQAAKLSPAMRQRVIVTIFCQRWQGTNPANRPQLSSTEMTDLISRLTPETRARFDGKQPADQTKLITGMMKQVARQELIARRGDATSLLPGFDEQLAEFFEQLSEEERDRLMSLPGDEMQQRLHELYLIQAKSDEAAGWRSDRAWRGKKGGIPPPKGKKDSPENHDGKAPAPSVATAPPADKAATQPAPVSADKTPAPPAK